MQCSLMNGDSKDLRGYLFAEVGETTRGFLIEIESSYKIIIFGGFVRDYLWGVLSKSRDIDLVLVPQGHHKVAIESLIFKTYPRGAVKKNQFGGFKIADSIISLDIWLLQDTWAFKKGLLKASEVNLLKSVYLNIDSYAYDLTDSRYIAGCDARLRPKEIDIVLEQNPNVELNILRALVYAKRYSIRLSESLNNKIKSLLREKTVEGLVELLLKNQELHYGINLLSRSVLMDTLENIKEHQ